MQSISQTLSRHRFALKRQASQSLIGVSSVSSIEESGNTTNNSIELLAEIDHLIDNKAYYNKFRKLIRDGFVRELRELAELAKTKGKPSRWFATATAKANWQTTLAFLAKARQVAREAAEVLKRLQVPADMVRVVYKACWMLKGLALRHAVTATETAKKDPFRYFAWLCWKVGDGRAAFGNA